MRYNGGMLRNAANLSLPLACGVGTQGVAEPLPDDPVVLKAALRSLQHALDTQYHTFQAQLEAQLHAQRHELEEALQAREAELHKAFEARILALYEQLRLARRRMFGPKSEAHAGQAGLFDEAEVLVESAPEASDTAPLPPPTQAAGGTHADPGQKKPRGKRKPLPIERKRSTNPILPCRATL